MPPQLELIDGLNLPQRGKHRNLDIDVFHLILLYGIETRVFECGCTCHRRNRLIQGLIPDEIPDASTQLTPFMKGHERTAMFFQRRTHLRRIVRQVCLSGKFIINAFTGNLQELCPLFPSQGECIRFRFLHYRKSMIAYYPVFIPINGIARIAISQVSDLQILPSLH